MENLELRENLAIKAQLEGLEETVKMDWEDLKVILVKVVLLDLRESQAEMELWDHQVHLALR